MIMEASAAGVTEESKASSLGNEDGIWDGMWQMYIGMTTANNPGWCPPGWAMYIYHALPLTPSPASSKAPFLFMMASLIPSFLALCLRS